MILQRISFAVAACACVTAVVFPQAPANLRSEASPLTDASAAHPAPPSWGVVITEFMKDPAHVGDSQGEWIEVYNPMPWRLNLEGWTLGDDGGGQHTISNGGLGVYVRPGEYFVLGRSADLAANGGVTVDYVYAGFTLRSVAEARSGRPRSRA